MMRTASIKIDVTLAQAARFASPQAAYADACNRLVPLAQEHRCWNRVALHKPGYTKLRQETPLGAQMTCDALYTVCKAYKSQCKLRRTPKERPIPALRFDRASIHFDKRTYRIKGESISLNTSGGRINVPMILGAHQRRILESGRPREGELVCRKGKWLWVAWLAMLYHKACDFSRGLFTPLILQFVYHYKLVTGTFRGPISKHLPILASPEP